MKTFLTVCALLLASLSGIGEQPVTDISEIEKKEKAFQTQFQEFRASQCHRMLSEYWADAASKANVLWDDEGMFRVMFELDWIHSSFGGRWDEVPAPTIRGSNATLEVDRFISEHGWSMLTNRFLFLSLLNSRGKAIRGLPWEGIQDRTFQAATHEGVLYVLLRSDWPHGGSGLAYNPQTNRFRLASGFKHIGDHWYVWRQTDIPQRVHLYEGEEEGADNQSSQATPDEHLHFNREP